MKSNKPNNAAHLRLVERSAARRAGTRPAPARPAARPEPEVSLAEEPVKSQRSRTIATLLELSDAQLVSIARAGDGMALEVLYRKHASFAIHLATRIEGSARDVEDIVHDAFIKAFGRLAALADPGAFRSWLGSIVVHAVRSRLRRARLMSMLGLGRGADPVDLDSITSSDASPHTRAQIAQIYALLRTLPTDERIAWTLRYVEGHELDVVAKLTDKSLATVKRKIKAAQNFLEHHFVESDSTETLSADDTNAAPLAQVHGAGARVDQEERAPESGAVTMQRRNAR